LTKAVLNSVDLCLDSRNRHSRIMQTLLLQCIELEVLYRAGSLIIKECHNLSILINDIQSKQHCIELEVL
jgi:hypothetical protein